MSEPVFMAQIRAADIPESMPVSPDFAVKVWRHGGWMTESPSVARENAVVEVADSDAQKGTSEGGVFLDGPRRWRGGRFDPP